MNQSIQLPKGDRNLSRLVSVLSALDRAKAWVIEIKEARPRRSNEQNAYLWGAVYPAILAHMPGWDAEDLHEYFLGEHFGWEVLEGFGKRRMKPIRRSSKLSTAEFMDFISFIQRKMAERGVYIEDPHEIAA